jgi:hypothetical protein
MITQKATFYDNFNLKTSSDYNGDVLVSYTEYDTKGQRVFTKIIDEYEEKFEYDTKNRIKRYHKIDKLGNKEWKTYSYSKDTLTILHKRTGNPSVIHKLVFGQVNENGERILISEKFI